MRLGIKYKLFFILLSASLVIIAFMFFFTRYSFERGLIQYLDEVQQNHASMMCQLLGEHYAQEGSWQYLRDNPDLWDAIERYTLKKWRRDMRGTGFHRKHHLADKNNVDHGPKGLGRMNHPRFILFDKNKQPLFPFQESTLTEIMKPIEIDGAIAGYLGMVQPQNVIQEEELLFVKRQTHVFLMIALCMVIISVVVAVWTAVYLERPIRVLTRGTKSLSSGHYTTRIPVKTKDELGQLSEDFNALAQTLEQNEDDRKKWVQDIAHELRTPLTLLSGELEAVEDGVRELTPETISRLQGDIQHLIRLVSDLNELSRTDKGALTYKKENVDLLSILDDVLSRHEHTLYDQNIKVNYVRDDPRSLALLADAERLKQLFGNIIENTMNYVGEGDSVTVRVKHSSQYAVVVIEDSGPGVPGEALNKLFDRLYRVEGSRNRRLGGSGLGLAICKNIVDAHGGSISAFASSLGGLGIRIEFPLHEIV